MTGTTIPDHNCAGDSRGLSAAQLTERCPRCQLLATVGRLHTPELATWLAQRYPEALPLVANGWTVDSALDHVQGICDQALCTHPSHQEAGA